MSLSVLRILLTSTAASIDNIPNLYFELFNKICQTKIFSNISDAYLVGAAGEKCRSPKYIQYLSKFLESKCASGS